MNIPHNSPPYPVNAHIYEDHALGRKPVGLSHGAHYDICLPSEVIKVWGLAVAQGYGGLSVGGMTRKEYA
jgi:hypothetical protein